MSRIFPLFNFKEIRMSNRSSKRIRKWVKREKRLAKLLYRKGFLTGEAKLDGPYPFKLTDLYWNDYKISGIKYRNRRTYPQAISNRNIRWTEYLPELHFMTTDYWGEADEHAVIDLIRCCLIDEGMDSDIEDGVPYDGKNSKYYFKSEQAFIKWLHK
jgi:hypothetical protein